MNKRMGFLSAIKNCKIKGNNPRESFMKVIASDYRD